MTVAQRARIQRKIDRYKKALSDQRARFGAIDDSQGLRYEIPVLQMRLLDLTGALALSYLVLEEHSRRYRGSAHVPRLDGDVLSPRRTRKRQETICGRPCFPTSISFPRVIGKPVGPYDMWYGSNIEEPLWLEGYDFRSLEFLTPAFLEWLAEEYRSDEITKDIAHFVELNRKLKDEPVGKSRTAIVEELAKMQDGGRGSAS